MEEKKEVNLKPSPLAVAVKKNSIPEMVIDTSKDAEAFATEQYNWDDITALKDEVAEATMEFVMEVNAVTSNKQIVSSLGDKREHFEQTAKQFFSDMEEFSGKFRDLRLQHEGRTGPVKDYSEFNLYNRLALNYNSNLEELALLVAPVMSELMLTVSEIVVENELKDEVPHEAQTQEQPAQQEENGDVGSA